MKLHVNITLTEEALGTKPASKEIFGEYIASLNPEGQAADELTAAEAAEKHATLGTTIFHRDADGNPGIWNYQVKGFFKDACGAMNRFDADVLKEFGVKEKLAAFKSKIDGCVFVGPRFIKFRLPDGFKLGPNGELPMCERPLRTDGPTGPRTALVKSETVPIGTGLEFDVTILSAALVPYVKAWLKYGELRGIGQWRNSGKGSFTHTITVA